MRRIGIGACIFILAIAAVACLLANNREGDVSVIIKSFTENGSYVEYPQIKGLGDRKKQERMNALLEEQVYTGAKIELTDFIQVDGRLIQSTDGSNEETDFNSAVQPSFHKFQDLFRIYTSEEEKDAYHIFSPQEIIDILTNPEGESLWYIDEYKRIVFIWDDNAIEIPYNQIAEIIYPQYLESLNSIPY